LLITHFQVLILSFIEQVNWIANEKWVYGKVFEVVDVEIVP